MGQIRNTKIREELNIFNLNYKIIKSRSQWKYPVQRMEDRRTPKKIITYTPRRRRKIGRPQLNRGTSILFKRTEQTTHGLIHVDYDDDSYDDYDDDDDYAMKMYGD
jgi:hypothetical protein